MVGEEKSEERAADIEDRLLRSVSPETKLRLVTGPAIDGNRVRWSCSVGTVFPLVHEV